MEEIPEKSGGRERWWRALPFHIQVPDPAKMAADEWSAAVAHPRIQAEHDIDLYFRVLTSRKVLTAGPSSAGAASS